MRRAYAVLDLTYVNDGWEQHLHPAVLFGGEDVVLIDCGYPGSLALLEAELARHGVPPERITRLLLTHQDDDHMGAAVELKARYPGIQVMASREEAPYISGALKNLRLQQAERMQERLPAEQKAFWHTVLRAPQKGAARSAGRTGWRGRYLRLGRWM